MRGTEADCHCLAGLLPGCPQLSQDQVPSMGRAPRMRARRPSAGEGTRGLPFAQAQAGEGQTQGWGLCSQGAATASWLLGRAASTLQAALLGHPHHPNLARHGLLQTGLLRTVSGQGLGTSSDWWGSCRSQSKSGIRVQVSQCAHHAASHGGHLT